MKQLIGETAGKIYRTLKENGSVSLADLPKMIEEKTAVAYQALGWLAREDKIRYETERTRTVVTLEESDAV